MYRHEEEGVVFRACDARLDAFCARDLLAHFSYFSATRMTVRWAPMPALAQMDQVKRRVLDAMGDQVMGEARG